MQSAPQLMKLSIILLIALACSPQTKNTIPKWVSYDESKQVAEYADNESRRMRYKFIQSKVLDKNTLWINIADQIKNFNEEDYQQLMPFIYEQDIPTIQQHVQSGNLTYESLTQWYLYRIVKYENNKETMTNSIVALNPMAVKRARELDKRKSTDNHPLYGMPILLKDNINAEEMPTTAGAYLLRENIAEDAFITKKLEDHGAIILGKTNLSEWANFLFIGGPNGFSAIGGQTLNAYGRGVFDTGGSSSGSGVAMATNYATAAVGTETSGSILSPSSQSSLVGLKPTVGLLSRSGIVPLSSTLDTPGPMTRSVIDNAILLSALTGKDESDPYSVEIDKNIEYIELARNGSLSGIRFGVNKQRLSNSLYAQQVELLKAQGGIPIEFDPIEIEFQRFGDMLSADMKIDLPVYLKNYATNSVQISTMEDIVLYNREDSLQRIPYGQGRFEAASNVELSSDELAEIKQTLKIEATRYFETPMQAYNLDVILSINNWGAGYAAAAKYPCLTVPMGYAEDGEPVGLTFIGRPFEEAKLLSIGYAFEQVSRARIAPEIFKK
jgi:amidase